MESSYSQNLSRASDLIGVCKNVPRNARARDNREFTSVFLLSQTFHISVCDITHLIFFYDKISTNTEEY